MKAKNLVLLIVVAAVLGGLAYLKTRPSSAPGAGASANGQLVLPALDKPENLNRITEIVVAGPGSTARVSCVKGTWVAGDKFNYPVRFDTVSRFLVTLSSLKVGQQVVGGAAVLGDLGLLPPEKAAGTNAAAAGTRITMRDEKGGTVAELLLGKTRSGKSRGGEESPYGDMGGFPDGRYLMAGSQPVLVSESLTDVPHSGSDWIDRQIANVDSGDLVSLALQHPDGSAVEFQRPDKGGELALAGLKDDEEADATKVSGLTGLLGYLSFSDVADPARKPAELGLDQPDVLTAKLKDGRTYTLKAGGSPTNSTDRFVTLSAVFVAPPAPPAATNAPAPAAPAGVSTNAPAAAKKDPQAEQNAKLAEEVKTFNAKAGAWTFLIAADKGDSLKLKRADLAKPKPPATNAVPAAVEATLPAPAPAAPTSPAK